MARVLAPVDRLVRTVGSDVAELLAPQEMPAEWFQRTPADPGLFGADSVVWRVHASRAGLIGGLRALMLQTMHPLAMAGVAEHSDYRNDPWGRLHRTGGFIGVTTYGTTTAATHAIDMVVRIHERVHGTAPDGRRYDAQDPELLAWVHDTEIDSLLRSYQRYGEEALTARDADRYVEEMSEIGKRLGVIDPPRDRAELRAALVAMRPRLQAGAQAREAIRFLVWPPLPLYLRPAYGVFTAAAIGLLPGFVRRDLRLPVAPFGDPVVVRPAAKALLGALGLVLDSGGPAATRRDASA